MRAQCSIYPHHMQYAIDKIQWSMAVATWMLSICLLLFRRPHEKKKFAHAVYSSNWNCMSIVWFFRTRSFMLVNYASRWRKGESIHPRSSIVVMSMQQNARHIYDIIHTSQKYKTFRWGSRVCVFARVRYYATLFIPFAFLVSLRTTPTEVGTKRTWTNEPTSTFNHFGLTIRQMVLQPSLAINELPWLKAFGRFSIGIKPINMASTLVLMDTGEYEHRRNRKRKRERRRKRKRKVQRLWVSKKHLYKSTM